MGLFDKTTESGSLGFWDQLKQKVKNVGTTLGSLFAKEKELTPGYKPPSVAKETLAQLFGVGERVSPIKEATVGALKGFAGGVVRGLTLGYLEPEALKPKTEIEKQAAKIPGTIGELESWLIPFGAAEKGIGLAIKGASKIPVMAKMVTAAAKAPALVKSMAQVAAPFAAISAIQKPGEGESRKEAAIMGALMGTAFPLVGAGLKPITKPLVDAAKKALENLAKKPAEILIKELPEAEQKLLDAVGIGGKTISKGKYQEVIETTAGVKKEIAPKIAPEVKKAIIVIPSELESLAREARKYKSAEEFNTKYVQAGATGQLTKAERKIINKIYPDTRPFTERIKDIVPRPIQDFYNQALKGVKEVKPVVETTKLPAIIRGETFTLGESKPIVQPTVGEMLKGQKVTLKQQKIKAETMANVNRYHGTTERITETLKKKGLTEGEIAGITLEDGTKLSDTLKVKRNPDKSLAAVITKQQVDDIAKSYTGKLPTEKWAKVGAVGRGAEKIINLAKMYELPQVWFERKGLNKLYEPIIQGGKTAEVQKNSFIDRFRKVGLWKNQGWFTADRFNLSKDEADHIGQYYLSRQGKGYNVALENLSQKERKFVEVFDGIIKDTEPKFFEVAKKNGKNPGVVENYAPIMTKEDIELIDKAGAMDFIFRKHPSFFSLKERVKRAPTELYETDYRRVAARWLDGITEFLNIGEKTPGIKYLIESDQFKDVVTQKDWTIIQKWLKDIVNPSIPETAGGEAVDFISRLLRKGAAVAALGLNYASVVKQALTQIPLTIIEKVPPKFRSEYAKAFGVSVRNLPSITKRKGDIAISDLQGQIGRIFTGPLTEFDRKNAQLSLNALLDKEYNKFLKQGAEITPEVQKYIEKTAQDKIDMWYGGFFKGQKPEAFRSQLGNFINMFIYPLTSQLNGFYRHILQSKGFVKTGKAVAEVLSAATAIAYMESAITKLSFDWSDEETMTKDVLQSLLGNIPIVSQISYAIMNDQQLQVSAGVAGISNLGKKITQYLAGEKEGTDVLFAAGEVVGLPKQFRRIWEGMELIESGGIVDNKGKMMAPVKEADEVIRSFLRGKYGSLAAQDWVRNIGEKSENRKWSVPQVEFLQNGDYDKKAELYMQFSTTEQEELRGYLSENQQKKLDKALRKSKSLFGGGGMFEKKEEEEEEESVTMGKMFAGQEKTTNLFAK